MSLSKLLRSGTRKGLALGDKVFFSTAKPKQAKTPQFRSSMKLINKGYQRDMIVSGFKNLLGQEKTKLQQDYRYIKRRLKRR